MIINYKLGKIFGPSMVFAGYILMVFGVLTLYFTISSIGLILIGVLIAFSSSGTIVEPELQKYKNYLLLAGVLQIGKKQAFEKEDRIEVKKFKGKHLSFSRSNRQSAVDSNDYGIYLITSRSKKKILMARFEAEEEATEESTNIKVIIAS